MFSISKNPQASMAEVLAKAEKYINGEEALISKKESSSTHKEKGGTDKRRGRSPKRQSDRERSPKKDGERSPKRRREPQRSHGPTTIRKTMTIFASAIHSLNSFSITSPARSTKRAVPKMDNSNEVRPHHKRQYQVL